MGTNAGIWSYTSSGTLRWSCDTGHKVTERGGSLALCDGILYATLKAKGGVAAVNMADGKTLWTYATPTNDSYHPVVDAEGTVYICEKNGGLYCASFSLFSASMALIFCLVSSRSSLSFCTLRFISSMRLLPFLDEIFRNPRLFS